MIPDAAIEAAAEAIYGEGQGSLIGWADIVNKRIWREEARAAIEAAMSAIREAIAQEIEAKITKPKNIWDDDGHHRQHNFKEAARIVRASTHRA